MSDAFKQLAKTIAQRHRAWKRKTPAQKASYVRSLFDGAPLAINRKIAEEARELQAAIRNESKKAVVHEAADLLFHMLVGLQSRGVGLADLQKELKRRFGMSGLEEKGAPPSKIPPMSIQDRIKSMMVESMKAKDEVRLNTVRGIKSALKYAEIEKIASLNESEIGGVLRKMIKQRQDSVEQFEKGGRQELADKEKAEIAIIQEFLPSAISEAELQQLIAATAKETGAASMKDMGKLMKAVLDKAQGRADGKMVSDLVKKHLSV